MYQSLFFNKVAGLRPKVRDVFFRGIGKEGWPEMAVAATGAVL